MSKRNITFTEAIREAVFQSINKDKTLFLMGEGVDDPSSSENKEICPFSPVESGVSYK